MYERIKELRLDRGKTQKEIAEVLGCSTGSYRNCENGKRRLSTKFLIKLVNYYKTNADYIVGMTDNPNPYPPKEQ